MPGARIPVLAWVPLPPQHARAAISYIMRARAFWRIVTHDRADLLQRFLDLLADHQIRFCLIGGQAVNAYTTPVVSLDLDVAVAADDLPRLEAVLRKAFSVETFAHSLNISDENSDLRIQIQTDPRYADFVARAEMHTVLDLPLPIARPEDLLQGKIWAVQDTARRASKRQKDLADIARLLETFPELRSRIPPPVLDRLL
jgi:hypothetical protein